jgi:hypothetical protein
MKTRSSPAAQSQWHEAINSSRYDVVPAAGQKTVSLMHPTRRNLPNRRAGSVRVGAADGDRPG